MARSASYELQYNSEHDLSFTYSFRIKLFVLDGLFLTKQFVSSNGSQLISIESVHLLRSNGVKHIQSALYHPSFNGQAEGFVQTMKRSLNASRNDGRSLSHCLVEFLLSYRTTPHATTDSSPAKLFLKRSRQTRFDLLKNAAKGFVELKQVEQKQHYHRRSMSRCLFPGSLVKVRNYRGNTK